MISKTKKSPIKKKPIKKITNYNEHLDSRYGKIGTLKRTEFEIKAKAFAISELINEEKR